MARAWFSIVLAIVCMVASSAKADDRVERGSAVWKVCQSCHMIGEGAHNRIGPMLNEVFGRKAASVDGYRYSKAMSRAGADGLVWTRESLDRFLANPKSIVSGTRMNFRGIEDETARGDVIAFLRTFSISPADLPESAPTAAPRDPDVDPAILAIRGDPDYGAYLSSECLTCHQSSGADHGIPAITGWPIQDFVVAMQAYKAQARPHPVMRMIAGRLSDEEIAALAAYFNETGR